MAYDKKVLAAVRRDIERERAERAAQREEKRRELYTREPRLQNIERQLARTASAVLRVALEKGTDPEQSIARIRKDNEALQAERAALLRALGESENALTDEPLCPVCDDSGYCGGKLCTCMQKRYADYMTQELSAMLPTDKQNFSAFSLDWYSTRPDARLGLSPQENMAYNLEECRSYAAAFCEGAPNLLLYGSTGLGKTFLSTCIAEAVAARGFSVSYDTAINIIAAYETLKFGNGNGEAASGRIDRYEHADLLIIDDMGTEMGTSFTVSALYNLINTRLMTHRPMIINTNLLPTSFATQYSPAVASRLCGEFRPLRFFGEDIRLKKQQAGLG